MKKIYQALIIIAISFVFYLLTGAGSIALLLLVLLLYDLIKPNLNGK